MSNDKKVAKKRLPSIVHTLMRTFTGTPIKEMTISDERYDSPSKLAVKRFFRKPLAAGAVVILISLFLFVFIGPLIDPVDINYEETLHINVAPNMSMMRLPASMKKNPVAISSRGSFTAGVDAEGKTYVWGYYSSFSKNKAANVMIIPEEVENANIKFIAAGSDHIVAIGDDSTVYAWGAYDNGQYGTKGVMAAACKYTQPDFAKLKSQGKFNVDDVVQLICGNQVSAILMKDGTFYAWGNDMTGANNIVSMYKTATEEGKVFKKLCFTTTNMFGITTDGEFVTGKNAQYQYYNGQLTAEYIGSRKAIDIAATGDSISLLLDDSEIISLGVVSTPPTIPEGDAVVSISAGSRHFSLVTEQGRVISWGNGKLGQTEVPAKLSEAGSVATVFASGFQNYAFDEDGKFVDSWGLKGYFMGTDDMGRNVFNRLMNGGRMTMTIGAVAVIVASIIGIFIGCISGYFGGMVDLLLMRVTEIFSAIPFLPFALVLSAILQGSSLKEDYRIFIIMIILGLLSWTGLATLVRGQILAEREKEFVIAARSMGIKEFRIAFKHILPNIISVILVNLTLNFASCMLTESSLSYLGFGVRLPRPTWGNMLDGSRNALVIQNYWWRWLFPALFLAVAVICINVIGDTLRDVLDPKSEVEK